MPETVKIRAIILTVVSLFESRVFTLLVLSEHNSLLTTSLSLALVLAHLSAMMDRSPLKPISAKLMFCSFHLPEQ